MNFPPFAKLMKNYNDISRKFFKSILNIDECPTCKGQLTIAERIDRTCWVCKTKIIDEQCESKWVEVKDQQDKHP